MTYILTAKLSLIAILWSDEVETCFRWLVAG